MAELINMPRAVWKRQPTGLLQINPNNPVTEGIYILAAPSGNNLFDYKRIVQIQKIGSGEVNPVSTNIGIGLNFGDASGSTYYSIPFGANDIPVIGQSIFWIGSAPAGVVMRDWTSISGMGNVVFWRVGNAVDIRFGGTDYTAAGVWNSDKKIKRIISVNSPSACKVYDESGLIINGSASASGFVTPPYVFHRNGDAAQGISATTVLVALWRNVCLSDAAAKSLIENPWQLFAATPSRFYLIPSSGAASQTVSFSIDALIQRAGLTQSTSLDALLQSAFSRSLSIDGLIAAVQTSTISMDALLQIVGTRTVSIDALLQAAKTGSVSVDALVQMTLAQSLSLDALIVAASSSSSSVSLDALIQTLQTAGVSLDALLSTPAIKSVLLDALLQSGHTAPISLDALVQAVQSGTLSLDALLSKAMIATLVMDALIQASKTGAVSLDAIITGASSASIFVGLDALIQAIQAKTISLDALLQKSYTSPLALDAYVALTQVKTMSLDALLQNTKTGVISMDAILQMTKIAMVSFDALIQAAKTGVISLDAILVFATQASVLLDAYVQKTLARGVGLDAIIGSIADMILPTGRVITVPASDRFVFVTHSDRVIQIQ